MSFRVAVNSQSCNRGGVVPGLSVAVIMTIEHGNRRIRNPIIILSLAQVHPIFYDAHIYEN